MDLKLDQEKPVRNRTDLMATKVTAGLHLNLMFRAGGDLAKPIQEDADADAGKQDEGVDLGRILSAFKRGPEQDGWLDELANALSAVFDGREPEFLEAVFQAADERQYRPVLSAVRRYQHNNALVAAHIAFHEVLTGPVAAPRELEALGTALRLGYRFRWEILDKFRNVANMQDVGRVNRILQRMEAESRQRNLYQPNTTQPEELDALPLVQAFEGQDRESMKRIYLEYSKYRSPVGNGLLDEAFESQDPNRLASCLKKLALLNSEFMRIGARRYAQLVEVSWPEASLETPKTR